jgi:hypothetical protein
LADKEGFWNQPPGKKKHFMTKLCCVVCGDNTCQRNQNPSFAIRGIYAERLVDLGRACCHVHSLFPLQRDKAIADLYATVLRSLTICVCHK